jgi:hypothetical protein
MAIQQSPKSRARALIKRFNEECAYTRDHLFRDIANEIAAAERRGSDVGHVHF